MAGKKNSETAKSGAPAPVNQDHFGFKKVPEGARQDLVNDVFDKVASKYDLMNDAMSGGLHRVWKRHLINRLRPRGGMKLLDVAGGTGDIAFRFLDTLGTPEEGCPPPVTGCDINPNMLEVGRDRAMDLGYWKDIEWVEGNAEDLPFEDESFDATTIAFGIRNVTRLEAAIKEAHRILKPGGRYLVLEFSSTTLPLIKNLYDWYSFNVIPTLGRAITGDEESYRYLVESIRKVPRPEDFAGMMENAGFIRVSRDQLAGGVVTLYSGWKV